MSPVFVDRSLMQYLRFLVLTACLLVSGFSSAQSASSYTWSAPSVLGTSTFTSAASDCASVEAALANALNTQIAANAPWTVTEAQPGSCTTPQTSGDTVYARSPSDGSFYTSINFVSGPAVPTTPTGPALAGGSGNQYVIECVPNGGSISVAPCTNVSSNGYSPVMFQGYVVDTSMGQLFLDSVQPISYATCGQAFAFGLIFVMTLYVFSHGVGHFLKFIRDA